jgi:signal transduction histidine kinase
MQTLENTPAEVTRVVSQANSLINLLLMNAREKGSGQAGYGVFSMLGCIRGAVAGYPFQDGERELVRLEGDDFAVRGSDVLFTYVMYNLLKNALSALKGGGEIAVRLQPGEPLNRVWFRDTGSGIAADILPRIFEEFYSGGELGKGTGMGLSFCRRVVTGFGGAIECRSREGEYTELEMRFPPLAEGARGGSDN